MEGHLQVDEELAKECLQHFIQNNWLGPYEPLPENLSTIQQENGGKILSLLVSDGEYPYRLVKDPILLLIACKSAAKHSWWSFRALFIQQRILDEPSASLKNLIYGFLDRLADFKDEFGPSIYVEASLICQFYQDEKRATELLELASKSIGFTHTLTGVLGRRTKFQSFDVAQLVVQTETEARSKTVSDTSSGPSNSVASPKGIELNDDVLLDKPELNQEKATSLKFEELVILLAQAQHLQTFHAKDLVITEKALAYVARVLEHPSAWSIYSAALYTRSRLESSKVRNIERATLQIQALVEQINLSEPAFEERSKFFFSVPMPSPWEMDRSQGYLFASLGAFKTALEIFDRQELWDEAISCLVQLGDNSVAEARIQSEIERQPENPKLWCLLGDIQECKDHYEKAWKISGHRYSRAQRSLGKVYFRLQDWHKTIECFELALAINPLFVKTWFLLGCACLQVDDLHRATQAFSRVVSLAPENAEAWNNLASIHLQQDRPKDALMALKEAARLDYDNGRIWENYFEVCLQSGELLLAVNALRRLAEIQEGKFDLKKYQRLVALLAKAIQFVGLGEFEVQSVKKRCWDVADQVLSVHFASEPDFWMSQARLASIFQEAQLQKEHLLKAYRAAKSLPFAREEPVFQKLVDILTDLAGLLQEGDQDGKYQLSLVVQDVKSAVSYPETSDAMLQLNRLL